MKDKYGISGEKLEEIKRRDKTCAYCHKKMVEPIKGGKQSNFATIEHFNHLPPWNNPNTIGFCCGSCNSSRRDKKIIDWFKTKYCLERNINYNTVTQPVRDYIYNYERFLDLILSNKWNFAKTMPAIPHYYIAKDDLSVSDQKLFDEFKKSINAKGYVKKFHEKEYKYIDIGGYKYWIIDNILNREKIQSTK